jgi:hypothetical protein
VLVAALQRFSNVSEVEPLFMQCRASMVTLMPLVDFFSGCAVDSALCLLSYDKEFAL